MGHWRDRDRERETGAATDRTLNGDVAAMPLDNTARDVETKPTPLGEPGPDQYESKRREEFRLNSWARVRDRKTHGALGALGIERDGAASRAELERVAD